MPCQFHELTHSDETFAKSAFEHFGTGNFFGAGLGAGGVVDVFGDDAAVEDGAVEEHGGEGFSELVPGDEGPEDPVYYEGGDYADNEGEAAGPCYADDGWLAVACVGAQRYHGEAEAADDAGAGVGALSEAIEHWEHVDGGKDSHYVGIASSGGVCETAPEGAEGSTEGSRCKILECTTDARMHHNPYCNNGPPAFIDVPPVSALWKPCWD